MKRVAITLVTMVATLFLLWMAFGAVVGGAVGGAAGAPGAKVDRGVVVPGADGRIRFVPVDVILDTGAMALGAYQFEVTAKDATIISLEGGEAAAFRAAPYYDPAALQVGNRLIVAAYSTDENLPTGSTRVARLHVMVTGAGDGVTNLNGKLVVATDPQGRMVETKLQLRPANVGDTTQGEIR